HWAFEGDTADSSGNGYDGDPCGSPSYVLGSSGQGKAISLDRGGDVITHNLVLPLQMGTVTHWLKPDMLDRMVAYYEGSGPENGWTAGDNDILEIHSGINGTDGRWYFCYQDGPGGGSSATITTAATAQAGVWTHFAATWDRSSDLILYADGVEIGRTDLTGENFLSNAGVYHLIGGPGDRDAGRDWDGAIDDVRVYDYALSPDEIETVMDGGSLGQRYYALTSPANVYDAEPTNSKRIDFKDYAQLADMWLDEQLWPR
ncbi:MAG: LamG domain-containing protein, partial [Phycisphaerales bacterium]